jgi:hypothetical protein
VSSFMERFDRVCCGSATRSCAGINRRRSSTRCSRRCWWVSRPTTRRAGQPKYNHSLLLFRSASRSVTVFDHLIPPFIYTLHSKRRKLASRGLVCTTSRLLTKPCLGLSLHCTTSSCSRFTSSYIQDLFCICTYHTLPVVTSSYHFRTQ